MKRYWLFEYTSHNECGGMGDWVGDYDTIEEVESILTNGYDPNIDYSKLYEDIEEEWKKVIVNTPIELHARVSQEYRNKQGVVSKILRKQDVLYHILDTQERTIILKVWEGKIIESVPLNEYN